MIERIEPGPRMSKAVVYKSTAYLAGVVDRTAASDVATQTQNILAEIERVLTAAGSSKAAILSASIWLSDISTWAEMNTIWDAWVDKANPPARATVEAKLSSPDYKVEIAVIAAVGK
jgi:enamine deaminase RidA (YjgF/YER057c/UK114 family)